MKYIKYYNDSACDETITMLANKFNVNKHVMEIIFSKGYRTEQQINEYLNPTNQPFLDSFLLQGMHECVNKIRQAIKDNKKILIFGDYDVDGISATAVMLKMFNKLGKNCEVYLPNRYVDGYGLTCEVIDKIIANGKPDLIITVDCGITCYKEVDYCFNNGIDIIITDHHEIPDILPKTIIVNPKLPNQKYMFDGLCGTGVAFKIAQAVLGEQNSIDLLPITAIATIADIVPLTSENRIIVSRGLKLMDKYLPIGLKSMFKANKISLENIDASDIAFKVAPKLNASGRMGESKDSLDLIMATDMVTIKNLISKISEHNTKRQELCNTVYEDCKNMLKQCDMSSMSAIILASDKWDQGILGIACSRLVEKYNRPVFLFSIVGDELKGSARSIPDINIHHVLSSMSSILEVFGGHKIAAGLTLKKCHYDEFCNRVQGFIYENIHDTAFVPIEYYDIEISSDDLTTNLINDLKLLEPCGAENTKPKFLIKSTNCQIVPLKNSPSHANIHIGKKLNLVYFHYLNEQAKLNFGKEYNFIFDLQNEAKSVYKGVVKSFTSSCSIKENSYNYFDSFKLLQLCYQTNKNEAKYNNCSEQKILELLMSCKTSVFGTCFVTYSIDIYKKFIGQYDLSNIYDIDIIDCEPTGFNSLLLSPQNLSWVKSFKNIVFLDDVLDSTFISEINKISNANIYVINNKNNKENNKEFLFKNINLDRKFLRIFYSNLINLQMQEYASIFSIYTKLIKENNFKISFNNYLFYYYILKELNILIPLEIEGFYSFKINDKIKSDLNNSTIYNFAKLVKKVI